ncbi:MAG: adenylate/guanylate cyclase domain-containing protein, partial [Cyanobacteriota bacterium]
LVLGVRHLEWLQPLELVAFDQMVRWKPKTPPDPRILVVAITEADIQAQNEWPLSDKVVAQLLEKLQQHQPKVIGLDLYRDIPYPPGNTALVEQLQAPNVIVIEKLPDPDNPGVPAPDVPEERIGFNDLVIDPDGVVRRNLMYAFTDTEKFYSFSLRLSLSYLADRNISFRVEPNSLHLGKTAFVPIDADSGGYQAIDSLGYQMLLNYRSPPVAQQVTLTQVLNGQFNPRGVKDKIVLIGTTAPSLKDLFATPYSVAAKDNPGMAGVIAHAQMLSQILSAVLDEQPLFWFWPNWVEVLWIGGWAVVGGSLVWRTNQPLVLGLGEIAAIAILLGISYSLFLHQGWVPVVAPALASIITGGSMIVYRMQQARRQQLMVMKLLGQQTSPEIAKALWSSRDRLIESGILPGQMLTATVLFTDIKNFSTISEQRSPAVVMSWLNEYLRVMTTEIQAHHGVINKFMGDGLMAVFGVPIPRTTPEEIAEDAQRAVNCALAMGRRLEQLNPDWGQRGLPVIQIRAGIYTGPVMVGSLGGKDRLEYGVIGDTVNTAARLESCKKDRQESFCRILIGHETLIHLQEKFQVEPWGFVELKGKQKTVDVYRVIGKMGDKNPPNPPY